MAIKAYVRPKVTRIAREIDDEDRLDSNFRFNDEEDVAEILESTLDAAWNELKAPAAPARDAP